jgi:DNA-binding transcriptional MerR regulator
MVYNLDMTYTVGKLAVIAGVSVRTLRHYDSIGILKPETTQPNGYRMYGQHSLLRLQQILLYKELGFELSAIKEILGNPDFDLVKALSEHKNKLKARIERLKAIIVTVDGTIDHLKGEKTMDDKKIFAGLTRQQEEEYAKEAEQRWDSETVRQSNLKWNTRSEDEKQKIFDQGNEIYLEFKDLIGASPESPKVQDLVKRWRSHIELFWMPDLDQLLGLADLYCEDSRFRANFDRIDPRLAGFIREAVAAFVSHEKQSG